jgi:hypothetical protein
MDGSPQRGSLHATTLWHFDAAEWAPSTASKADIGACSGDVRFTPDYVAKLSLRRLLSRDSVF